jgi:hypothetical protein
MGTNGSHAHVFNKPVKRSEVPTRQLDTGRAERLPERVNCASRYARKNRNEYTMKNPLTNKYVLVFICLAVLVGCVVALSGGSAFVQGHSLAILIVFLLIIVILDVIT